MRTKPNNTIIFNPIIESNGVKLISYTWKHKSIDIWNEFLGDTVLKRVSDWDISEINKETGKEIVHVFTVEEKGEQKQVSFETAMQLLKGKNAEIKAAKSAAFEYR